MVEAEIGEEGQRKRGRVESCKKSSKQKGVYKLRTGGPIGAKKRKVLYTGVS